MFDEVQTGMSRTGYWFAHQFSEVRPDVVTSAKALGNGVPIGACWARSEISASFRPGEHGSTFGGQPLAAAAACATLDVMEEIDAPARAAEAGSRLRSALESTEGVASVRGRGLLLAAELDLDALPERYGAVGAAADCLRNGLVVNAVTSSALRFTPPLTVTSDEIDEAVRRLETCLARRRPCSLLRFRLLLCLRRLRRLLLRNLSAISWKWTTCQSPKLNRFWRCPRSGLRLRSWPAGEWRCCSRSPPCAPAVQPNWPWLRWVGTQSASRKGRSIWASANPLRTQPAP